VKSLILDLDCGGAQQNIQACSYVIEKPYRVPKRAALDDGIPDVCQKQNSHQAEYPLSSGIKVSFEAVVVRHLLGKKQDAQQEHHNRIHGYEKIKWKCPLLDSLEPVFPPPKMDQVQK
jgi:hypothetical protein